MQSSRDFKPGVVVLFSGGADSLLLAEMAVERASCCRPGLLTFSYGQQHSQEVACAEKLGREFGAKVSWRQFVDLTQIFGHIRSALLGTRGVVYPGVHSCYVPGRNSIFVSFAMAVAESRSMGEIWLGADLSDRENCFPDCTQDWVIRMDALAQISLSYPVRVRAPLLGWTKDDVKEELVHRGHNLDEVYSGYGGTVEGVDG